MQMNDMYQQAIDETLHSTTTTGTGNPLTFVNATAIPLNMYWISTSGEHYGYDSGAQSFAPGAPPYRLDPDGGKSFTQTDPEAQWYWLFTSAYSGAPVSASLSSSSTTFQQFTTTTQTTSYVSDEYGNSPDNPSRMFLYWQLADSVTEEMQARLAAADRPPADGDGERRSTR
nr:hypothetical protein OG999_48440 [Streptomyces sp. NBC_00886]